jgi:hypothetical protein
VNAWRSAAPRGKRKAAKKAEVVKDTLSTSTAWHIFKKAHLNLGPNTAYLNSGSSHHMISDCKAFASYTDSKSKIELANGKYTISPGLV